MFPTLRRNPEMNVNKTNKIRVFIACACIFPSHSAFATNGYFSHGASILEKSLGGAGVAYPQDTLSSVTNPAGMVWLGNRWDVVASLFSPRREYTIDGALPPAPPPGGFRGLPGRNGLGDPVESDREYFAIPQFGWNRMLDENHSIGVTISARGGMNSTWRAKDTLGGQGPGGAGDAGLDLAQVFAQVNFAQKLGDHSSWGISPIFAYQRFEAKGLGAFSGVSNNPSRLTDNGYDSSTGYGFSIGWQGRVAPRIALGAAYQSRIWMDEFDRYAGLFAEQGDFDIPPSWTLGIAVDMSAASKLLMDVEKIRYSEIASVGNPSLDRLYASCSGAGGTGNSGCLGGDRGTGFAWQDMTIFKIGYQWVIAPRWTGRAGYSRGEQPIDGKQDVLLNLLAPGVTEEHYTFGVTHALSRDRELSFSFLFAPESCTRGRSDPILDSGTPPQTTELCMHQYEISVGFGRKF